MYLLFALYCSAPPAFFYAFTRRACRACLLSSAAPGIQARVGSVLQAHFLPKDRPSSAAQTAHCVRIILYVVESRGGSHCDAKAPPAAPALLVPYLLPLANSLCAPEASSDQNRQQVSAIGKP